jgi:hypothetical protein
MADPTAQRIWNTALGQFQLHVTRPNYDTWLKETEGLRVEPGNFVVGVGPATRTRSSTSSFYGAKESAQPGPDFPKLPTINPLDRSKSRCYGLRHPLRTGN